MHYPDDNGSKQITFFTKHQSKIFIKKVLAACISMVASERKLLPESAFSTVTFGGVEVKILSKKRKGASSILNWMKNIFKDFDEEDVQSVVFSICSDPLDSKSILEAFEFEFAYQNESSSEDPEVFRESDPTVLVSQHSARNMLRYLFVLSQSWNSLPSDVYLNSVIHYRGGKSQDFEMGLTDCGLKKVQVGKVVTPHFNINVTSTIEDCEDDDASPFQQHGSSQKELGQVVRCSCGLSETSEELLIICSVCRCSQHAICYGVSELEAKNLNDNHVCTSCFHPGVQVHATKSSFYSMEENERKQLCLWRRTLKLCFFAPVSGVSKNFLSKSIKCSKEETAMLMNKLTSRKVFKSNVTRSGSVRPTHELNLEVLCRLYDGIFQPDDCDD